MRDMMAQIRDCGDGIRGGTYTMTAPVITGGSITGSTVNNAVIGGTTRAAGSFTTVTTTNDASISGLTVGKGGGAVATNNALGTSALAANTSGSQNTAVGYNAGTSNTTGAYNLFAGVNAGQQLVSGSFNTALGNGSLNGASGSGNYNTSVGNSSLASNTTASLNTASGYQSMYTNTTGQYNAAYGANSLRTNNADANTAMGSSSMYSNTTGSGSVGIGTSALYANTTGANNVALGYAALGANTTASNNTAVGYQAMYSNATGTLNTAIGVQSLYTATSNNSTALGYYAGRQTTTGNVTAIGGYALYLNTTGTANTAVGHNDGAVAAALQSNTTGSYNVAVGTGALKDNTTASNNVAVGYNSGQANVTGTNNTYVGVGAGYYCTGSKNTILGNYNGNQSGLNISSSSNYIVLSDGDGNPRGVFNASGFLKVPATGSFIGATGAYHELNSSTGDTMLRLTNTSATPFGVVIDYTGAAPNANSNAYLTCQDNSGGGRVTVRVWSNGNMYNLNGTYGSLSDETIKQDIVDAGSQWEDIKALKVRKYRLKSEVADNPNAKPMIGLVAQELETTSAGLVDEMTNEDGSTIKGVKYSILYMKAVKALQEAIERIETLEAKVTSLENK
jgi:hypothetical protein